MDRGDRSTSPREYVDFDLEIREGGPHNYPVSVRSPVGEAQEEMRFPYDEQELENKLLALENALLRSGGRRRRIRSPEEQTVQQFGGSLFQALFVGQVRAHYAMSLAEVRRQKKGLRLKLRIHPPELAVQPWEFLYDPGRDEYLCLSSKTPLVRYVDLPQSVERLPATPPLRILGMVAGPLDLDPLDVEHEKRLVEEATKNLRARGLVELSWVEGESWRDLQRAIRRGSWHIFHFIGHGDFDPESNEGRIAFSDEAGCKHLLKATHLARLLDDIHPLRLVVLNSCEGARGGEGDPFSSTAATLVRRGIPAVVAMQYEITDKSAIEFSRTFYQAVADSLPVDAAVSAGRVAVSMEGTLEWGTPVLYTCSPDGRIFDIEPTRETEDRESLAVKELAREPGALEQHDGPTGVVTFLFTDIEGSTALWENHPAEMQEALVRHDEILRAAVEASGGHVFKTIGDTCCAAFATAKEALEATLAAQRALFAERWSENATVRVRMTLHTGVAEERDGDYFGPPVNRVARMLSAGHGGQILLSAVTYGLVRDALVHLEPEAEIRDLGEHRLKDLRYTEHIFQLSVPDLPADFPPLKTHGLVAPAPPVAAPSLPEELAAPSLGEEVPRREAGSADDRYERKRLMGSGGMAEVYLAHDELLDRDVALKVLRKQYADDEQFVERFEREAKNAASLTHPNIAAVYDRGETEDGSYYIVMEYVSGGSLKERVQKEGPLLPPKAVELTLQIARALEAAHRRGVIHRDVKPQNVLLTESGEAKVADFGIARATSSSTMTKTGAILGTAHYLSPEQALGEPASPQSDLYSLGVVLYEMLTGTLPYDAETPVGVAMKHVSGQLRLPKEVNPEVPEGINAVCARLLARDPKNRYRDATELIKDLERVRRGDLPASAATAQQGVSDGAGTVVDGASIARAPSGRPRPAGRSQREANVSPAPQGPPSRNKIIQGLLSWMRSRFADSTQQTGHGDFTDRTEHDVLFHRYREAVESVWADKELNTHEAEWLRGFANDRLGLTPSTAAEIECEVMGDTKETILERQEQAAGKERREARPEAEERKPESLRLFCSYSHKDETYLDELKIGLVGLVRQGLINEWNDREILAGEEWEEVIDEVLRTSEIILLLVSPHFMASDYAYEKEMTRALDRHERGEARVIPIIIRPTDWEWAPFSKLQVLPKDAKPIAKWPDRDDAWLDVVRGIRKAVRELTSKPSEH